MITSCGSRVSPVVRPTVRAFTFHRIISKYAVSVWNKFDCMQIGQHDLFELNRVEKLGRAMNQLETGKLLEGAAPTLRCSGRGKPPPFCGCTLCCVSFGTRGSSRLTRDWALSFLSRRERVNYRRVTLLSVLTKSWHDFFLIGSAKSC